MQAWIFQAKPEQYEIKNIREHEEEIWLVTRYRHEMSRGDIVFFWRAGDREERGIYGWGNIIDSEPHEIENWGYGVRVEYRHRFDRHLSVDDLEHSGVLSENLILRMPIGTNFRVSQKELKELALFIRRQGEEPPVPPQADSDLEEEPV